MAPMFGFVETGLFGEGLGCSPCSECGPGWEDGWWPVLLNPWSFACAAVRVGKTYFGEEEECVGEEKKCRVLCAKGRGFFSIYFQIFAGNKNIVQNYIKR
jgi:hypothetical protein